jgi:hypothetical protein
MCIKIPDFSFPFSFDKFTPQVLMKIPFLYVCVIQASQMCILMVDNLCIKLGAKMTLFLYQYSIF